MTFKDTIKNRYANGNLPSALVHIIEIVAAAAIVGLIAMYGTVSKMEAKADGKFEEIGRRLTIQAKIQGDIRQDIKDLSECVQKHMSDFSIHYPHNIPPAKGSK